VFDAIPVDGIRSVELFSKVTPFIHTVQSLYGYFDTARVRRVAEQLAAKGLIRVEHWNRTDCKIYRIQEKENDNGRKSDQV
jgi:hypothetical protein